MTRHYLYCGLLLASDLFLPELAAVSEAPTTADLTLHLAPVPASLHDAIHRTPTYEYNGREALWRLDGVARYLVREGGRTIEIDPAPGADAASVRLFLLQPVFSLASVLRGEWILTASAVEHGGRISAFIGPTASGKSTAAAILLQRGYRLVSDSLLRITRDSSGRMMAHPQAPWLWLWPDAVKHLGLGAWTADSLRPGIALRRLGFPTIEQPLPLTRIAIFREQMGENQNLLQSTRRSGGRAFELLLHLNAGTTWLEAMAHRPQLFNWCVQIATATTIERLDIPWGLKQLGPLADQLAEWCNQRPPISTARPELESKSRNRP